jgi:predicted nucleic acid-binding protein
VPKHIFLDSTPLGLLTKSTRSSEVLAITMWSEACLAAGHQLYVPEVIDYELRRELIRAAKLNSLRLLDDLKASLWYVPISTAAMLRAASMWAQSRNSGQPTGSAARLDIDVILAAQALTLEVPNQEDIVIATSNVGHLTQFTPAYLWTAIKP